MKTIKLIKSVFNSIKQALASNPDVQKLEKKHPRFFNFLGKRMHWRSFWGMPFTALVLIFIYFLFLFYGTTARILNSDPILFLDVHIENLLYSFRNPAALKIFHWITLLGNWQVILCGLVAATAILLIVKKKKYILPLWLITAGTAILSYAGKLLIQRPRPQETSIYEIGSFSFPSSHAAISIAFYGFIAYIIARSIKKWKYKLVTVVAAALLALMIGLSRIYLGFHFLSDIAGGYLLGALWLLIGIGIIEWIETGKEQVSRVKMPAKLKILAAMLVCAFLAFYVSFALIYNPPLKIVEEKPIHYESSNIPGLFNGANALPKYTEMAAAQQQEPISFIIIAKDDNSLINAFQQSGWYLLDTINSLSMYKLLKAAIFNKEYLKAPFVPSFWNGKAHNYGFQKPTESQTVRQRHHARFWKTNIETGNGQVIYIGTASLDQGIKWFFTHRISPDLDSEREFLFQALLDSGMIMESDKVQFVEPEAGVNFANDPFFTDGKTYIIYLK